MRHLRRANPLLSLLNPMFSIDLKPEQFSAYPPEARKLATNDLAALQRLPLSFLPSLLREVIDYDFKFPAERKAIERELANLSSLSPEQSRDWFQGFAQIRLSPQLEQFDWINAPAQFVEQLSAYLWTTHQLDAFRVAALAYADRLRRQCRRNLQRFPDWESLSSVRASPLLKSRYFVNFVPTACITVASNRKTG